MDHRMTTTTFDLEGYRVARHLGVVRGITVRSLRSLAARLTACASAALRSEAKQVGCRRWLGYTLMLYTPHIHRPAKCSPRDSPTSPTMIFLKASTSE